MSTVLELDLELRQGSFELRAAAGLGPTAAVVGPSGAGKTTLLEAVAGLRWAKGWLRVGGELLQDSRSGLFLPPERRRLGYVPQDGALFPHLSVRRNLSFGRRGHGPGGADWDLLVRELDLAHLLERYPRHLSGGERRRVALARALLARPRLLLLDEPTAGLDALRARKALAGIRHIRAELGVPMLVVTHRREEALALAADVVLVAGGEVVRAGPAAEVWLKPASLGQAWDGRWANVAPARVIGHDRDGGTTELRIAGGELIAIPCHEDLAPGCEVLVAIDAEDLLLATTAPGGLSARNALVGEIAELISGAGSVYARVGSWFAHLTPAAAAELDLVRGHRVWLVAKSHSWRVVAG